MYYWCTGLAVFGQCHVSICVMWYAHMDTATSLERQRNVFLIFFIQARGKQRVIQYFTSHYWDQFSQENCNTQELLWNHSARGLLDKSECSCIKKASGLVAVNPALEADEERFNRQSLYTQKYFFIPCSAANALLHRLWSHVRHTPCKHSSKEGSPIYTRHAIF